jgi:hypothetical protein
VDDATRLAAMLLVAGPLIGAVLVANPPLLGVWTASREVHLATVGAHRRGWALVNLGFGLATILTSGGLLVLAGAAGGDSARGAALVATAVAYTVGGVLWCSVLAIRTRTTPRLADLVASGDATEPVESLLGSVIGGLFGAFALATAVALVALGGTLLLAGGIAAPVAATSVLVGVVGVVWLLAAGDLIPAVLYLPTLVLGIALLAGWT